jgi:hypothetical protein
MYWNKGTRKNVLAEREFHFIITNALFTKQPISSPQTKKLMRNLQMPRLLTRARSEFAGLLALLAAACVQPASADDVDPFSLSPEQLFNATVTSVSKTQERLGDAPAAIFVLTDEDIARSGATSIPVAVADVRAVAERALKLDIECAEAYATLAMLTAPFAHHDERLRLATKALALAPADPWIVCVHANALWSGGQIEEALAQWECAAPTQALSPQYIAVYAQLLLAAGRTDQALAVIEDAWSLFRRSRAVWQARFDILSHVGPWEEAEQMLTAGAPLPYGLSSSEAAQMHEVRAAARLPRAAREQALRDALDRPAATIEDCLVAANVGEPDVAFDAISRALESGSLTTRLDFEVPGPGPSFQTFAFFTKAGETLRANPTFSSLAERLALPAVSTDKAKV